ncbi:three-helix bundle dimerization domain-containing protein [Mycolicibacterium sp. XJ1904]
MIELNEQQILDQIADRLAGSYPSVPADAVTCLVREQYARFADRPIRDFIPLFVERQARAELERIERPAARV